MADSVIPILSKGTEDLIESKEGKLWHILTHSLRNPGFTSDIAEDEMISFRELEARFGNTPDILKEHYRQALGTVVKRHYPDDNIDVYVEIADLAENTYTLQVGFIDGQGNPLLTTRPITITEEGIDIDLNKVAK